MTELILLILAFSVAGVVYGFYDVVQPWLKPKAKKIIPAVKRLIPKKKPKLQPTSPQDVVSDAHAMVSRPWVSVLTGINASAGPPEDRSQLERSKYGAISPSARAAAMHDYHTRRAQAAQQQQNIQREQNDLFWRQIAEECQKITGCTDFRSSDPDLGRKKYKK